jgi:hypothetical protein
MSKREADLHQMLRLSVREDVRMSLWLGASLNIGTPSFYSKKEYFTRPSSI